MAYVERESGKGCIVAQLHVRQLERNELGPL